MNYPYLGVITQDEKNVVVMFNKENHGMVLVNETDKPEYQFGKYGEFDEDDFDFLSDSIPVTLRN